MHRTLPQILIGLSLAAAVGCATARPVELDGAAAPVPQPTWNAAAQPHSDAPLAAVNEQSSTDEWAIRQVQHLRTDAPQPLSDAMAASTNESAPRLDARGILPPGLTLLDLEQIALGSNPTLGQADARVLAARGNWTQVGLKPNPVIGYQGSEIGNEGEAGQQGGFISQEFVTADKLELNRAAASYGVAQAQQVREAQHLRVLTSVRTAFYEVLVAQRMVEVAGQLQEVAEQSVDVAEELLKAQQVSRVDLLQAKLEANKARIQVTTARNRHLAAWTQLLSVVGLPSQPPQSLAGSVEADLHAIVYHQALDRLLAGSPQLAAARANVGQKQMALRRARVEPIPNVEVQAGVQKDYATRDTIAGLQVGIPLPIHDRNQGNICKAHAELVAAQQEVQRLTLLLENRLAGVMERYMNASYQVEQYKNEVLPDARESLELVEEAYRQQEFDYLRLLTTQRTYFEANLRYLDALRNWWTARLEIDGLLLSDGLQNPGIAEAAAQ